MSSGAVSALDEMEKTKTEKMRKISKAQNNKDGVEVLGGLVAGLPNKTLAYDLGLSARTVESHRAHIMSKMHARSFSELVWLALAAGVPERV